MTRVAYASVSFSPTGPAKNLPDLAAIQRHNNREEPLDHVVEGAPPPEHLVGTGDLRADVCAIVQQAGIDPMRRRANGALAQEVIFSADHDWFFAGSIEEQEDRLNAWVLTTLAFLRAYWGQRLASVVLHRDEYTPHIHVVVVPLQTDTPEQTAPKWRLVIRELNGPGKWAQAHTNYAATLAPLGLARGKVGSERKRKPYSDLLRELKDREDAADAAIMKAKAMQREAAYSQLHSITEEHRLRAWGNVLRDRAEALDNSERDLLAREREMTSALATIEAATTAAENDRIAAGRARHRATVLRDLVMTAQERAREVFAAVEAYERTAPGPALAELVDRNQALRGAANAIKVAIERDDDLLAERNIAWGAAQRGGRGNH